MNRFFTILFLLIASNTIAQNNKEFHKIDIQIKGIKDTVCYLGNYFFTETNGRIYIQDTARVDHEGRMSFNKNNFLQQGLYIVTVPTRAAYFELLITDQQVFSIETDTTDLVGNMKVGGSTENLLFNQFRKEMNGRYQKMVGIDKTRKGPDDKAVNEQIKTMQAGITDFQQKFFKDNAQTFVVKFIKSTQDPTLPEAMKYPKTAKDTIETFNYYKNHFLDNLDLTDERLLRTPYLGKRLQGYMNFGGADIDTLSKLADNVIAKTEKAPKEMRKAIIYYLTNLYESGDEKKMRLMGTEGVFVHMGKKYYIGQPALWDTSTTRRFKERIATLEQVLIGKTIHNMQPTDSLTKDIMPLYDVKSKYTVLFIFDPDCGHCQETAPKLVEWHNKTSKYKDLVKVYAVSAERGEVKFKAWKKFLNTYAKGNKFINGFDSKVRIDFRNWYDTITYPAMFILDKDKKIVGRGIGLEDFDGILSMRERIEKDQIAQKAKSSLQKK
jgi:thiol-disulfide isomerase/thioredoxin